MGLEGNFGRGSGRMLLGLPITHILVTGLPFVSPFVIEFYAVTIIYSLILSIVKLCSLLIRT